MNSLAAFTDAIRWWGALSGLIGVADVWRWYRARSDAERFYQPARIDFQPVAVAPRGTLAGFAWVHVEVA